MGRMRIGRVGAEFLLTLLALAWLAWLGRGLGGADWLQQSDGRYLHDGERRVDALAEAARADWLQQFCGRFDAWLPPGEAKICADFRQPSPWAKLSGQGQAARPPARPVDADTRLRLGEALADMQAARGAWAKSFYQPLDAVEREREAWRKKAQEGFVGGDGQAESKQWEDKTRLYRDTYRLNVRADAQAAYSRPVECAFAYLSRQARRPGNDAGPVLAVAGWAAVLDGAARLPGAAFPPGQDWDAQETADRCPDSVQAHGQTSPFEAAQAAASILHEARASALNAAKARASLELLPKLWPCLLVWALAGWLVLQLGRRLERALGVSLLVWALAYALTRPHLEWLGLGGLLGGWMPLLWLAGAAALLGRTRSRPAGTLAFTASRGAYPGFVLFVGLGWMLLADLATYAYPDNRFHALYQQAYVFLAFLLVSVLPALSIPLARLGLALWTLLPLLAAGRMKRTLLGWGLGAAFAAGLLVLVGVFFTGHRQNTSEIFRFVLLSGLAWFLLARAEALASDGLRAAQNRPWWQGGAWSLNAALWGLRIKLALPLLWLLGFVAGGFFVTRDKGPLLVVLYAGAVFFSLLVARLSAAKLGETLGLALGMLAILPYVWLVSYALFRFGGRFGEYIAERLESAQTPFLASNDQIAQILWFQQAALEDGGFGLGLAPWCGELSGACRGVPPQIQSDYIYTALVGVFGSASWLLLALFVLWLWRLARAHPAVTSGQVEADGLDQAWLSWMALCWAGLTLAQVAVTVAGNRGWLPLTGITFPFLSYGAWSLLGNTLFLGLSLHLHRRI